MLWLIIPAEIIAISRGESRDNVNFRCFLAVFSINKNKTILKSKIMSNISHLMENLGVMLVIIVITG